MKKVSISLPSKDWGQIKSKYPADSSLVGADEFTAGSFNMDTLTKGVLNKRLGGVNYNGTTFSAAPKDQYEAIFNDGAHHLLVVEGGNLKYSSGDTTFSTVTSGYSATANFEFALALDRVYGGNGVTNITYDKTASYGGVAYTVPKTKVMGCQAPSTAPTAPAGGTAGGSVPVGTHTYKVTFLYYGNEESNGSASSGVCTVAGPNQTVGLTAIPVGGYGVTARKVYRDNNDGNYLLVGTISDNTTLVFSDTLASAGAAMPTDNGVPPVFGLVVHHLDRLFFAKVSGASYTVYYSNAGFPDIVGATNFFPCNQGDPITALVIYLGRILVFNRHSMGQILGETPDTFRYSNIQGGAGCVDNRSIQVRTVGGVPSLVWLSDKGFYSYNGSSVDPISDPIEDIVNLNIQQAQQTKGTNTQSTQADFQAGTASGGIDLLSSPGDITTRNPKRLWDDTTDWEAGSSLVNVATKDGTNTIKAPIAKAYALAAGSLTGAVISGSNVQMSTISDFTGQSNSTVYFKSTSFPTGASSGLWPSVAFSVVIPRASTISTFRLSASLAAANGSYAYKIWSDSAGAPGTELWSSSAVTGDNRLNPTVNSPNLSVAPGTYWIGAAQISGGSMGSARLNVWYTTFNGGGAVYKIDSGSWTNLGQGAVDPFAGPNAYIVTQTPVTASGQWLSEIYDTYSTSISTSLTLTHTGSFPSFTSGTTTAEGSNDGTTWDVTQAITNPNGANVLSVSGRRYWRVRYQLNTTDNRVTPSFGAPTLKFATTSTWISEAIDCTANVTVFNSLTPVSSAPSGTSVAVTAATSADNVTYSAYAAIGSVAVARYIKVKVVMTTDAANTLTPTVTSLDLRWTIVANLVSSAINTGVVPAGWDIFQQSSSTNGGTLLFEIRSASSSGGLAAASYSTVTNGAFPTATPLQYVQYRVTVTSTADAVPTVSSITLNWFVSNTDSIRVASLFYNRTYFLAAAEFNSTTNNLVFVLDGENKWRIWKGNAIATFSLFFNEPYFGKSTEGRIVRFLSGLTDGGTNIEFDVRTKAFDFSTPYDKGVADKTKVLRSVKVVGKNTAASYTAYFSVDGGTTWTAMIDETGVTSWSFPASQIKRLQPSFTDGNVVSGRTIAVRLYSNDAYEVEVRRIKIDAFAREGGAFSV